MSTGAVIAGIGQTAFTDGSDGRSGLELALEAIVAAVHDAGLEVDDVDGIVKFNIDPSASHDLLIANLGLPHLRFAVETPTGGSGLCSTADLASMAVTTGRANAVVCFRCFTRQDFGPALKHNPAWLYARASGMGDFVRPHGWGTIGQSYALQAARHMAQFGSKEEHLGAVVQACTKHAAMNPNAMRRREVSIDEYLAQPYVTSPFRELDCFINPCAGACAYVVTTAERAADLRQPPAHIASAVTDAIKPASGYWELWPLRQGEITGTGADVVGPQLWERTGLTPDDVDVAEIYDCFSYTVLSHLEAYGFCGPGEAGDFVEGGRLELGGDLPTNTHGGNLGEAYIHAFNHILEAVRQIRGTSTAQVKGAKVALVTGGPAPMSSGLLLTKEAL